MKTFTVNEKNFNQVMGILAKFLSHDELIVWHTWDYGMKKRIKSSFIMKHGIIKYRINTKRIWHDVCYRFWKVGNTNNETPRFYIYKNDGYYAIFPYGDVKISFLGNRVIIKKYDKIMGKYLYVCFQILK